MFTAGARDHGGGLDAAVARYGGERIGWMDLSTGINPVPYPVPDIHFSAWTELPDQAAHDALERAARQVWRVPDEAGVLCSSGASAVIARCPSLCFPGSVTIPAPTYNEHAAAFRSSGWHVSQTGPADAQVVVHPNNPDGRQWTEQDLPAPQARLTIIDESFCDLCPEASLIACAANPGTLFLKSFGKFWGLAGLRLGFAIGDPDLISRLQDMLGPWAVSGPALTVGTAALQDSAWTARTRSRLAEDSARLDGLMRNAGAERVGGTSLFRLYRVDQADIWQARLAEQHIWTRVFPYNAHWLRLGLPAPNDWPRLEAALRA